MLVRKALATVSVAALFSAGFTGVASADHRNSVRQAGVAGGLVAAVVNANVTDVEVITVDTGDINVALTNVLNNNRILTNFLNQNDVTVTDVVDVTIVDNVLVISVLS